MNGKEAINLTKEANLVCQTEYINDITDKCPLRQKKPITSRCCNSNISKFF